MSNIFSFSNARIAQCRKARAPYQSRCLTRMSPRPAFIRVGILTSCYDLALGPPLPKYGEEKSKRVSDGHSQAQLCLSDEEEEPYGAGDVEKKRQCIRWSPKHVRHRENTLEHEPFESCSVRVFDGWMDRRLVTNGSA